MSISTGYRKISTKYEDMTVYQGVVSVYENDKYLYKLNCDIDRLNINDALFDAINLKKELEEVNNVNN